jgi:hypothetical protein
VPPAYWDIARYFSELEEAEVWPERRVAMDGGGHPAPAALKQPSGGGVSGMEGRAGVGALGCAHRSESVRSGGTGAQAEPSASTVAGRV